VHLTPCTSCFIPQREAVGAFLEQLAVVLPGALSRQQLDAALRHAVVCDWTSAPHICGGYSAPSAGESPGARAEYRQPECGGRLCFAGEATEESMMTMNAALESGRRAAAEALLAVGLAAELPSFREVEVPLAPLPPRPTFGASSRL